MEFGLGAELHESRGHYESNNKDYRAGYEYNATIH